MDTPGTSGGNILLSGSSIPGVMSRLNLFLTKVRHPTTEDALDAFESGTGPAIDVVLALESLSYADCKNFGEYEFGADDKAHLEMYSAESIVQRATELAAEFRREVIDRIA